MKTVFFIIAIIVLCLVLVCIYSYINHKIKCTREKNILTPMGQMISVNDHNIHIYKEGNGTETLVFLSGGGTCSPVLDFRTLYQLLQHEYQIVVVEKAGYGFSDIADVERDIDTILFETREALKSAEIYGPFILLPHSMSGLESLYWANQYPDEVKAIVGLDMAVPKAYDGYKINKLSIYLGKFISDIGITRLFPQLFVMDALKTGNLTNKEKALYQTLFYHRTFTKPMLKEIDEVKKNAKKVNELEKPIIPMLLFVSNGVGTGVNENQWQELANDFIKDIPNASVTKINCSHYLHNIEYENISKQIKSFIKQNF